MFDILKNYYPEHADLDPARVQAVRASLALRYAASFPELDTSPNSVFGDNFLTPTAWHLAAVEEAWRRFRSDLQTAEVAKGVVYDCDFVSAYLEALAVRDEGLRSSAGVVRLSFETGDQVEVDRGTVFTTGDASYLPYAPKEGPVVLLPEGSNGLPNQNWARLERVGESLWVADILICGDTGVEVGAGTAFDVDREISGLASAVAAADFIPGNPPATLKELAEQARTVFNSVTPVTRDGVRNFLAQKAPEITAVSPVASGDDEMARDVTNPFQVRAGNLDILVRAPVLTEDRLSVKLRYFNTDGGFVFFGRIPSPETLIRLKSLSYGTVGVAPTIYSVSSSPATAPGCSAAYGDREQVWVEFPMPTSEGSPLVPLRDDGDGFGPYAWFDVVYEFDAYLRVAQGLLGGETFPGIDAYVRWFVPVVVSSCNVRYNRKAGVAVNLSAARAEILEAFNTHCQDKPATLATVADSMLYAGAVCVNGVDLAGTVRFTVAGWVYTGAAFVPPVDAATHAAFVADCDLVPSPGITSVILDNVSFSYPNLSAEFGPRNTTWLLETSQLTFEEERSV